VHAKHFTAKTPATKQKYREEDKKLRAEMTECLKTDGWDEQTARLLANWDPYDQNASASFFDPKWMFGLSTGFDIVLGNPPYIQLQKSYHQNSIYADLYKDQNYKAFDREGDIYCLFYEQGVELLREGGLLAYITSNKWMRTGYGEKLREYFATQTNPLLLIDLGPGVFKSATVDTSILLMQRAPNQNRLRAFTYTDRKQSLRNAMQAHAAPMPPLTKDAWFIGGDAEHRLKQKIERIGKPLREWEDVEIYYGIKTGLDKAFIIDTATRQRILNACKDDAERQRTEAIIKPILRGRDIKRYTYKWKGQWVILAKFGFYKEAHLYPAVVAHLSQYEQDLRNRGQCRYGRTGKHSTADYPGQHHWLELDNNPRDEYLAEFEKEKVVWQRITRKPTFCLVDSGIYILDSMAFFVSDQYLKYEMAVLNSSTILYYTNKVVHQYGFTGFRLANQYVEVMPIPPITPENQSLVAQIELLVNEILKQKRGNPHANTRDLERAIDELVYRLYDLTDDEIRLIESKLSKDGPAGA